jgi:hypothetical protein
VNLAACCFILAQFEPTSSLADRVSAHLEAGTGAQATTLAGPSTMAASGSAEIGVATSGHTEGVGPYLGVTARGDTGGYGQAGAGVGIATLSRDLASWNVRALALGGITTYQTLGSVVIPMAGAEVSVLKRLGEARNFALGGTLGAAVVFPVGAGDGVDLKASTITSSDPVGYAGWGRLAATYYFSRYFGAGAFFAFNLSLVGSDFLTTTTITSSWLSDFSAVSGLQLIATL